MLRKKNINSFAYLCLNNPRFIFGKKKLLEDPKISYSDRVYVDISVLLKNTNSENSKIIWQHLLTIWGLIDPTSEARRILKEASSSGNASNEENFLSKQWCSASG